MFAQLGIPVYDADSRAKAVMTEDLQLVASIKALLGNESYDASGNLNRPYISQLVFHDKDLLNGLNALVHPAVFKDFDVWVSRQQAPYVLKEAALLIESGSYKNLDALIVVLADADIRLKRSMKRDGSDEEAIRARMQNQIPQQEKALHAQYLIHNNHEMLIPQVLSIHKQILALS